MTNFLEETLEAIADHNLTTDDVDYVSYWNHYLNKRCSTTWAQFAEQADFDYDAGFGENEIALHLFIVFKGGMWLEREEYDGAEGWVFNNMPTREEMVDILQDDFWIRAGW